MTSQSPGWMSRSWNFFGQSTAFWLTAALLLLALMFGGASRQNLSQVILLELASLPLLAHAVWRLSVERRWPSLGAAGLILAIIPAIPLLQLLPVPFELWAELPGHANAAEAARQVGLTPEWRAISLAPAETWRSLLAILPPMAIFLGASLATEPERRRLCVIVPAMAVISLMVGALQLSAGDESTSYFYDVTNLGSPVGLFANRNHQASLLILSIPFAALWLCNARGGLQQGALMAAALAAQVVIVMIGLVIVGSRAGVLLVGPALVLAASMLIKADRFGGKRGLVAGGFVVVGALIAASFVTGPLIARFASSEEQRFDTAPVVAATAWRNQPIGAGLGSFPSVYAGAEPVEIMGGKFFNHAHNDYLEIWLETGVLGVATLLGFIAWWASRSYRVWTLPTTPGRNLARAGASAVALLLVHSLVDYPVRTLALAAVLGLSCALLASRATDFSQEASRSPAVGNRKRI